MASPLLRAARALTVAGSLLASLAVGAVARAADRHVPSQYPTIQAAVNAAADGDTIRIAPGTYNERVQLGGGKHVAFRGEVGKAAQTIISSSLDGATLSIFEVTNPALLGVSDLTLTHSVGFGLSRRGLFYSGPVTAPLVIERCIIRNNYSNSEFDDAGAAKMQGRAEFRRCAFIDNRSVSSAAVVLAFDNCPVAFIECSFRDHTTSGGGLFRTYSNAPITVTGCTIRNANLLCSGAATVTFANNRGCSITTIGGAGFVNGGGNVWNSCPDCDSDGLPNIEEIVFGAADCNANLIPDSCDIAAGTASDINGDGIIDVCQSPTDRHVPSQYPTIQAAVNASLSGDTIRIAPGIYNERVLMEGRAVALRGEVGKAAQTIINAAASDGGAVDISGVTTPSQLGISDLTLTHSSVPGISRAGLRYGGPLNAPLVVERCILRNNYSTNDNAGGAYLLGRVEFYDCAFIDNRTGNHGSAVYAYDNCPVTLVRCSFRDHTTGSGMFYARNNAAIVVSGCVIRSANVLCSGTPTGTTTFVSTRGCLVGTVGGSGFVNGGGNNWKSCLDCDGDGQPDLEELIFGAADCDGNGIPDSCDLSAGSATDFNANGILDACECPADIVADGSVDGSDLATVLGAWGAAQPGSVADIVRDGQVNGADLALVLANWGLCK